MVGFIFGGDTGIKDPKELARQRALVHALMSSQKAPRNVGEGLSALGDGIVAAVLNNRADAAETAGLESAKRDFSPILGAMGFGDFPPRPEAPQAPAATGPASGSFRAAQETAPSGMDAYRNAIASIESAGSGDYGAVGPTHPELGRALGKYQVMEANIGPWSEAALGQALTPEQFLADPKAQDAVFDHVFKGYVDKYGPEGAAQAWFAGPGGVGKDDRQDSLGTNVGEYGQKFMSALGGGTQVAQAQQPQTMTDTGRPEMAGNSNLPSLELLLGAADNPWMNQNQSAIIKALTGQRLKEMDPTTALQRRKLELELQNLENPQGDPFTLSPGQTRFDAQGKPIAQGGPDTDAPTVQTFYDEQGREYKAQWNPQTREWSPVGGAKAPSGFSLRTNPDGSFEMVQGNGKLTENQSKLTLFQTLQTETQPVLLDLESRWNPANLPDAAARSTPIAGNFWQSEPGQMYQAAATAWAEGALRIATGAAATPEEMERTKKAYFAQPGDTPNTIAFKAQMREMYNRAIDAALGKETQGSLPKPSEFAEFLRKQEGSPPVAREPMVIDGYTIEEVE